MMVDMSRVNEAVVSELGRTTNSERGDILRRITETDEQRELRKRFLDSGLIFSS